MTPRWKDDWSSAPVAARGRIARSVLDVSMATMRLMLREVLLTGSA